jgi:phage tail protein X
LNQRISSRGVLEPLNSEQAAKYVECRLSAQGSSCAAIFEPRALSSLLKRSDGIPRKINMLCHTAMQAAFYGGEKKVSFKTAKRVAAQYRDSVDIVKRGSNSHPITMGALIAATAFAALLLLAFFHPSAWLDRTFGHSESLGGTTEAAVSSTEATNHVKSGGPTRAEEHLNSIAKSKPANHLADQPVETRPPAAPRVMASTTTKSDATRQMTASEAPAAPSPPPLSEASSNLQKQAEVPAAPKHRNQVTVRYGDTIEKIAIRCFGSKAGINEIMAANPQLTNINQLSVGEVIYLPAGIAPKASQDETEPVRPLANAEDSPDR